LMLGHGNLLGDSGSGGTLFHGFPTWNQVTKMSFCRSFKALEWLTLVAAVRVLFANHPQQPLLTLLPEHPMILLLSRLGSLAPTTRGTAPHSTTPHHHRALAMHVLVLENVSRLRHLQYAKTETRLLKAPLHLPALRLEGLLLQGHQREAKVEPRQITDPAALTIAAPLSV
jgi:hypothetical protein